MTMPEFQLDPKRPMYVSIMSRSLQETRGKAQRIMRRAPEGVSHLGSNTFRVSADKLPAFKEFLVGEKIEIIRIDDSAED